MVENNNINYSRVEEEQLVSSSDVKSVKENQSKQKIILIELFKQLLSILENNHLRYWMCGGSMLGTVRHQGIIPWDDDIDIFMPRDDYERFLDMAETTQLSPYKVVSPRNGFYSAFAKFCDDRTTIWESQNYPYILGVYIDIFPLDYSNDDINAIIKHKKIIRHLNNMYRLCFSTQPLISFFKNKYYLGGISKLLFSRKSQVRHRLNVLNKSIQKYSSPKGWALVSWTQYPNKVFQSDWFAHSIQMPFEDIMVQIPEGYHEFLALVYGDYMTFPPIEKRKSNHPSLYRNFEKKLSFNEVLEKVKNGIHEE